MGLFKESLWKAKSILVDLECPILVFPVLVVMIVAITFLFPSGHCGAWQWWLGVTLTIALCFYRSMTWRRRVAVLLAFLLVLATIYVFGRLVLLGGCRDAIACHYPAIRLMADGWNPVWQNTFLGISESCNISADYMSAYHIIAMPKSVWYFDAAASFFFHNEYNLLFPIVPFLLLCIIYTLIDVFRELSMYGRLLVVAIFLWANQDAPYVVDVIVAISALGLLAVLYDNLKTGRWNPLRLLIFTFWMVAAKPSGLLHGFVFWCVFIMVSIIRKNWKCIRSILAVGGITVTLFAIVSVSPYLSSYLNFGSPFYPRYSGDEQKYPTCNISGDFLIRNDDAAAMGHIGAYVNAFISSYAARLYYRSKTGNKAFKPYALVWEQSGAGHTGAPTKLWYRVCFVSLVMILLWLGGTGGRFVAISVVLGTLSLPTEMIGYVRYTPWALGTAIFCVPLLYSNIGAFRCPKCERALVFVALMCLIPLPLLHFYYYADDAYAVNTLEKSSTPKSVVQADCGPGAKVSDCNRKLIGNLLFLKRHTNMLKSSEIIDVEGGISLGENTFYRFPSNGFAVSADCNVLAYSEHERLFSLPRGERLKRTPLFVIKTLLVTLPKNVVAVLFG